MRAIVLAMLVSSLTAGCATNSITGRTQLQIASDESVIRESKTWYRSVMNEYHAKGQLKAKPEVVQRAVNISNRLIDQAVVLRPDSAHWDWDLEVINSKELNAFCMAGGKMAIYTGLIDELKLSDDEIATVMGHEIAHALVGHSAERMSVATATNVGVLVASYALGKDGRSRDLIYSLGGVATMALISMPHSRYGESEADEVGLRLAAMAGFNPVAGQSIWQKMDEAGGQSKVPEFLSTHPSNQTRQENLSRVAQGLTSEYEFGVKNRIKSPNPWIRKPFNETVLFDRDDYVRRIGTQAEPGKQLVRIEPASPTLIKPLAAPVQIAAFKVDPNYRFVSHSPRFDIGREELNCKAECTGLLKGKVADIERAESTKNWKMLATSVLATNYKSDLNYYLLARAARGLGNTFAAVAYYSMASKMADTQEFSCQLDNNYPCSGVNMTALVETDLRDMLSGKP